MKKLNKLDILPIITRISFWLYIAIFMGAIFFKPLKKYILPGLSLLLIAFISEFIYQLITGFSEAKKIKTKKRQFKPLPAGQYEIKETKTSAALGTLSNENLDFLRKKFLEQGMDDNDFYFLSETLEMFFKEEKPNKELTDFLNTAMKNRDEIELHWEPMKS
jgi:hypothetical protein